jgi:hypothetical protein
MSHGWTSGSRRLEGTEKLIFIRQKGPFFKDIHSSFIFELHSLEHKDTTFYRNVVNPSLSDGISHISRTESMAIKLLES